MTRGLFHLSYGAGMSGTPEHPWLLQTPSLQSEFQAYRDEGADPPALVAQVGKTEAPLPAPLHRRSSRDARGGRGLGRLGSADEQKPAAEGTVEAWARSPENPVGGWYGLKKGLRGRFANYVPPVLEALGLAEVEHSPRNNRMRAL